MSEANSDLHPELRAMLADGVLTTDELGTYLKHRLAESNAEMTPVRNLALDIIRSNGTCPTGVEPVSASQPCPVNSQAYFEASLLIQELKSQITGVVDVDPLALVRLLCAPATPALTVPSPSAATATISQ